MIQVTINAGESMSSPFRVGAQTLAAFHTTDAWDAADLVLHASDERDGTYLPVCKDDAGAPEYLVPFDTGKRVVLDANALAFAHLSGKYVTLESVAVGDATTPVNQTAQVTIHVETKDA